MRRRPRQRRSLGRWIVMAMRSTAAGIEPTTSVSTVDSTSFAHRCVIADQTSRRSGIRLSRNTCARIDLHHRWFASADVGDAASWTCRSTAAARFGSAMRLMRRGHGRWPRPRRSWPCRRCRVDGSGTVAWGVQAGRRSGQGLSVAARPAGRGVRLSVAPVVPSKSDLPDGTTGWAQISCSRSGTRRPDRRASRYWR